MIFVLIGFVCLLGGAKWSGKLAPFERVDEPFINPAANAADHFPPNLPFTKVLQFAHMYLPNPNGTMAHSDSPTLGKTRVPSMRRAEYFARSVFVVMVPVENDIVLEIDASGTVLREIPLSAMTYDDKPAVLKFSGQGPPEDRARIEVSKLGMEREHINREWLMAELAMWLQPHIVQGSNDGRMGKARTL